MLKHQDDIYPVYFLNEVLSKTHEPAKWAEKAKLQLVSLNSTASRYAVAIDKHKSLQQSSLGTIKRQHSIFFSDYTVSGDGNVVLIIDLNGVHHNLCT